MASAGRRGKEATSDLLRRTSRDEALLREVRWRLSKDRDSLNRLRRLERMERTARLWSTARRGGPAHSYLDEVHDNSPPTHTALVSFAAPTAAARGICNKLLQTGATIGPWPGT